MKNYKLFLFLFAFLLRLSYVLFYPQIPVVEVPDADAYVTLAKNLADGNGYTQDGSLYSWRPPGYPFFIGAIFFIFGKSFTVFRIIQTVISSLTVVLIYLITKQIFGDKIALISGILSVIYPPFIFYSGLLLTETIYTFLLTFCFYILTLYGFNKKIAIFSGIYFGIIALVRSENILFPFFLLFLLFFIIPDKKNFLISAFLMVFFVFLIIIPWGARNYTMYHEFFLIDTKWDDLWLSTYHEDWREMKELPEPLKSKIHGLNNLQIYRLMHKEAIKNVVEHPVGYLKKSAKNIFRFWIGSHTEAVYGFRGSFRKTLNEGSIFVFIIKFVLLSFNSIIVFFGLIGLFKFLKRNSFSYYRILMFAPILFKFTLHMLLFTTVRFQVPIMPFVIILCAYFLFNKSKHYLFSA